MYRKRNILIITLFIIWVSALAQTTTPCDNIVKPLEDKIVLWQKWAKTIKERTDISTEDKVVIRNSYEKALREIVVYSKKLGRAFPNQERMQEVKVQNEIIEDYTVFADSLLLGSFKEASESADVVGLSSRKEKMSANDIMNKCSVIMSDQKNSCYKFLKAISKNDLATFRMRFNKISYKKFDDL